MSYTINRNVNYKAIKKNINISNTSNSNSLKQSLGSTGSSDFLSLDSLNLNSVIITANASQLNYLQVIPGIATVSKALVLDSSKNISGINILTCNYNIIVNNTPIQSNDDLNTGSSDDLNNPYLINTIPGTALANKTLVVNSKSNISNINKLTTNTLQIKNNNINFNNNEVYKTLLKKSENNDYTLVVAELTNNHIGQKDRLVKMIKASKESGADMTKVQKRDIDTFYSRDELQMEYSSPFGNTLEDYRRGVELNNELLDVLVDQCQKYNIC